MAGYSSTQILNLVPESGLLNLVLLSTIVIVGTQLYRYMYRYSSTMCPRPAAGAAARGRGRPPHVCMHAASEHGRQHALAHARSAGRARGCMPGMHPQVSLHRDGVTMTVTQQRPLRVERYRLQQSVLRTTQQAERVSNLGVAVANNCTVQNGFLLLRKHCCPEPARSSRQPPADCGARRWPRSRRRKRGCAPRLFRRSRQKDTLRWVLAGWLTG